MIYKDATSVIKEIKSGQISPVYLLHGEEAFYIDEVAEWIELNFLSESEKAFNQEILYGRDLDSRTVIDHARQFPMMSQYRVIVVREAQDMNMDNERMEAYMAKPSPNTVLVLAHKNKKADSRLKWVKLIKEKFVILESNSIKDYQLQPWIYNRMKTKGFQIDNKAVELVAEYLGTDLSKLTNELDKLIVNIGEKKKIGLAEVEKNIGISKDYNVFELQEAIASKNVVKTQRIIENFQGNMKRNPIELVIGSLFSYFQKLYILRQNINSNDKELSRLSGVNPYFLKKTKDEATNISLNGYRNVFKILRDYDGRTKGMNNRSTPKEELLKELVGKLLLVP